MANTSQDARGTLSWFPWRRLGFLLGALIVYRIGAHIPVPGIEPSQLKLLFNQNSGGILGLLNVFSGGALSRFTVFALGITPYISASIIIQLLSVVVPSLESIKKEGESGRRKIATYTRYSTLVLAFFQALGIVIALEGTPNLVLDPGLSFRIVALVSLVTGTMFLMWLGEQVTERGLGNGISIIIFAGIVAGLPNALGGLVELIKSGSISLPSAALIFIIVLAVTFFVVFVEKGQRRILISYAKRQVGNRVMQGQNSHLPLKINMSGVIPPIFASSLVLFPATISSWFSNAEGGFLKDLAASLAPGEPMNLLIYTSAIVFFCFFYTALVFNSKETAENLRKSSAFVPGIRPGVHTAGYIDTILMRLTLIAAFYVSLVCLLPEFMIMRWQVPFYFGGTSLLIIVVVTMDFMAQVQNYFLSSQYPTLMKKNSLIK